MIQVGDKLEWIDAFHHVYVVVKITTHNGQEDIVQLDGPNLQSGPVGYRRSVLDRLIERGMFRIVSAAVTTDQPIEDCPECWGTGYYKGYGVVCSKGCRVPAEVSK